MKGFTLIELIVVFSISAMLGAIGIASYASYNDSQAFESDTLGVITMLNTAKSHALSKAKPPQCANMTLQGYQVTLSSSRVYTLSALCGGNTYVMTTKNLSAKSTFAVTSAPKVEYNTTGAIRTSSVITIVNNGRTKTIRVNTAGTVSVQ